MGRCSVDVARPALSVTLMASIPSYVKHDTSTSARIFTADGVIRLQSTVSRIDGSLQPITREDYAIDDYVTTHLMAFLK